MKDLGELSPVDSVNITTKRLRTRATIRRNNAKHPNRPSGPSGKKDTEYQWRSGRPKPFIAWDGEGYNDEEGIHHYMLFGSSHSKPITGKNLSTKECLDAILDVESRYPNSYHIAFAFEYDVNMILADLPQRHMRNLKKFGEVRYKGGYRIAHIPHVFFQVSRDKVSVKIYDIYKFFNVAYLTALDKFNIGNHEDIAVVKAGKEGRSSFSYSDLDEVERYWRTEIRLMPDLADAIRNACYNAGFFITDWHGPGALARYLCKLNKVQNYMDSRNTQKVPTGVKIARQAAYAGGRFQGFRAGNFSGNIYVADINGAYIYAATKLPRLDNGRWRRVNPDTIRNKDDIQNFGLYRISYDCKNATQNLDEAIKIGFLYPQPLFHRDKDGGLSWPFYTEGWYWSPEAKLVAGNSDARFLEAWVYDSDDSFPFAHWIYSAHARRIELQKKGDPAERSYKWALAAIYGQWAQRIGWNTITRKAPRTHQIEWAGYITSWCRAEVWKVAMQVAERGALISIDTDGVCATVPFTGLEEGENLGQWKLEEYSGIIQWQTSMYWLRGKDGQWRTPKTRGIKRGKVSRELAEKEIARIERADIRKSIKPKFGSFVSERTSFWGYGRALNQNWNNWRKWETIQSTWIFGGRTHIPTNCIKCMVPHHPLAFMHSLVVFSPYQMENQPHKLPWLEPDKEDLDPEGATILDIHHIDDAMGWDKLEIYHDSDLREEW
jgi:hypothetical protein